MSHSTCPRCGAVYRDEHDYCPADYGARLDKLEQRIAFLEELLGQTEDDGYESETADDT